LLNLQSAYELRLAEQAAGPEIEALPVMPDSKATPQQPSML
jgi:antitoxin HigA-1